MLQTMSEFSQIVRENGIDEIGRAHPGAMLGSGWNSKKIAQRVPQSASM